MVRKNLKLSDADLDEIGVLSLRCGMTIEQLRKLLDNLKVKYTEEDIQRISKYRNHVKQVTERYARGL